MGRGKVDRSIDRHRQAIDRPIVRQQERSIDSQADRSIDRSIGSKKYDRSTDRSLPVGKQKVDRSTLKKSRSIDPKSIDPSAAQL
jgi:hypothetical protein